MSTEVRWQSHPRAWAPRRGRGPGSRPSAIRPAGGGRPGRLRSPPSRGRWRGGARAPRGPLAPRGQLPPARSLDPGPVMGTSLRDAALIVPGRGAHELPPLARERPHVLAPDGRVEPDRRCRAPSPASRAGEGRRWGSSSLGGGACRSGQALISLQEPSWSGDGVRRILSSPALQHQAAAGSAGATVPPDPAGQGAVRARLRASGSVAGTRRDSLAVVVTNKALRVAIRARKASG